MTPVPIPHTAKEIADDLTRRIGAGEFPRGARLPTYDALAAEYGSARRTVAAPSRRTASWWAYRGREHTLQRRRRPATILRKRRRPES
ncbi:GntR family transcriptional regulator [Micromonospora sp. NPDC049282]|uniref:GntR family transcriptional regulator n=1 Tax=Micromonospora sp. NPDC049282 TaxID=3364269 RepID=UPI00371BEC2B